MKTGLLDAPQLTNKGSQGFRGHKPRNLKGCLRQRIIAGHDRQAPAHDPHPLHSPQDLIIAHPHSYHIVRIVGHGGCYGPLP